jgi:formylglycine-generating enzyme required for sulfatase activity/serine/threonine protein kinase/WD40 repeat protein
MIAENRVMACPDRTRLLNYVRGNLAPAEAKEVIEHLVGCVACDNTVAGMEAEATTGPFGPSAPAQAAEAERIAECQAAFEGIDLLVGMAERANPAVPAEASDLRLKQLGEYQLLEKLGEGGMGAVYKARHTRLDRIVALKVLPKSRTADRQAVARFEREMKAVGRLDHPNIVRAMDAREIEGTMFLVMEYVDGLNLADLAKRVGPLPIADACELARQTALGLQYAYQHRLVHRDIKPSNLMLTRGAGFEPADISAGVQPVDASVPAASALSAGATGPGRETIAPGRSATDFSAISAGFQVPPQVKILDLGLALLAGEQQNGGELTSVSQTMGTADYMAPEQTGDSHHVDVRADVYALGCTLYKLLTGQAPFTGSRYKTAMQKMIGHMGDTAPPLRQLRGDVPALLAAVVERMMAKDRDVRYATPAEVALALTPFVARADLVRLMARAESPADAPQPEAPPVPTDPHVSSASSGIGPMKRAGPAKAAHGLARATADSVVRCAKAFWGFSRPHRKMLTAASLLLVGLGIALGIVLRIRDKSGRETVMHLPDDVEISVSQERPAPAQAKEQPAGRSAAPPPLAIAPFDAQKAKQLQEAWARHLGVPVEQTNSIGMKMVLIPPGEFEMGSSEEEVERLVGEATRGGFAADFFVAGLRTEAPRHRVRLTKPFSLGMHEVTVAQFRQFVKETGYKTDAEEHGKGRSFDRSKKDWQPAEPPATWRSPGFSEPQGDDHPVVLVTWNDAMAFCLWLSNKEGKIHRLPTEAEWEYACRAGTATRHQSGDSPMADYAWFSENARYTTHPVGAKKANAWGLFDMAGNACELCVDWFAPYSESPQEDPLGPPMGVQRAVRGGHWASWTAQSAWRGSTDQDGRDWVTSQQGFRVVRDLTAVDPPNKLPDEHRVYLPGEWIDLLELAQKGDRWVKTHPGTMTTGLHRPVFQLDNGVRRSVLAVPLVIDGGYELVLGLKRPENVPVAINFPVGTHTCTLVVPGTGRPGKIGLEVVEGRFCWDVAEPSAVLDTALFAGRSDLKLHLEVECQAGTAKVDLLIDGRQAVSWSGEPSKLSHSPYWGDGAPRTIELASTDSGGAWVFESAWLCLRDGRADFRLQDVVVPRMEFGPPVRIEPVAVSIPVPEKPIEGLNSGALVGQPAKLPGVRVWTVETTGHRNEVTAVEYRPDGRLVATAARGDVCIWEPQSRKLRRILLGHSDVVTSLAWSPDGKYLASADGANLARIWDVKTARILRTFQARRVAWSPDGTRLAGVSRLPDSPSKTGRIYVWDATSGEVQREIDFAGGVVAWSPDGRELALGSDCWVVLIDASNWDTKRLFMHDEPVWAVAWSPDGRYIAAVGPTSLGIWQGGASDEPVWRLRAPAKHSKGLTWSRSGHQILAKGTSLWDLRDGSLARFGSHDEARHASWAPDLQTLTIGSGTGAVWDLPLATWKVAKLAPERRITWYGDHWLYSSATTWSPDGKQVAAAGHGGRPRLYRIGSGDPGETRDLGVVARHLDCSPRGSTFVAIGWPGTPILLVDGETTRKLDGQATFDPRSATAWSPDGAKLAVCMEEGKCRIWDAANTKDALLTLPAAPPVAWSPDGKRIAAGNQLFDAETGKVLAKLELANEKTTSADAVRFSPDNKLLAFVGPDALLVLDAQTGKRLQQHPFDHGDAVGWSADGRTVTVVRTLGPPRRWVPGAMIVDIAAERVVATAVGHGGYGFGAVAPDGKTAVGRGPTGTLHWWDCATGERLGVAVPFCRDVEWLIVSPEGHYRASPEIEEAKEILYVAELDSGEQVTLTPEEFAARFGWKNDPAKAIVGRVAPGAPSAVSLRATQSPAAKPETPPPEKPAGGQAKTPPAAGASQP